MGLARHNNYIAGLYSVGNKICVELETGQTVMSNVMAPLGIESKNDIFQSLELVMVI